MTCEVCARLLAAVDRALANEREASKKVTSTRGLWRVEAFEQIRAFIVKHNPELETP